MAKAKVYIDGQSGTTGLQIFERIAARDDLELLRIPDALRHDVDERRRYLNAADVVFLCLPDDAAREAVSLVDNPDTRVIDASTAHRTAAGWTYGFPELSSSQRSAIAASTRIANPGCHATGFISLVAPLVQAGLLPTDYPLACTSLTGYSGGGKAMIADYEAPDRPRALDAPAPYALGLAHKHLPEMQAVCGLDSAPAFLPVVDDYYKGMATTVLLHTRLLAGAPTLAQVHAALADHYAGECLVEVAPLEDAPSILYANELAGTNRLRVVASGNDERVCLTALFDNLGKGASGAAVQNMNIALGLDETLGLV